jgi:uncharacterized membrane protein YphA (DoxX/SURF4 family)
MHATAPRSGIFGSSPSMSLRAPMKLTIAVWRSLKGGPGRPAQLNTASTGPSICATTESIDAGSRRSSVIDVFTGVDTGLRSSAVTFAPSSCRIRATCSPMPDAAPVTTTSLPSYPRTSSIGRSLTIPLQRRHFRPGVRGTVIGYGIAMTISSFVARPLLAGMFIYGGLDAFKNPSGKTPRAEKVAPTIADVVGIDADTEQLVQLNGAVQVAAGITLALGILPRVSALLLAVSLVPTTLAGHRFWEEEDEAARAQQTVQFLKNAAMMGGLLLILEHG